MTSRRHRRGRDTEAGTATAGPHGTSQSRLGRSPPAEGRAAEGSRGRTERGRSPAPWTSRIREPPRPTPIQRSGDRGRSRSPSPRPSPSRGAEAVAAPPEPEPRPSPRPSRAGRRRSRPEATEAGRRARPRRSRRPTPEPVATWPTRPEHNADRQPKVAVYSGFRPVERQLEDTAALTGHHASWRQRPYGVELAGAVPVRVAVGGNFEHQHPCRRSR